MKTGTFIVFFLLVMYASGQIQHPKASPFTTVVQEIGLSKIKVEYSRPAIRGRKIFGNLVPYGRIWRVGANASTKITVDADMNVMGKMLPKGTYALYAFPRADVWEVVFHKNTTHWGDGRKAYNSDEDVFRVRIVPEKTSYLQENFLITFDAITHNSLKMLWIWEHTKIVIPITVDTHVLMLQEIATKLSDNPTAQTYYEAARYLQEQKTEYPKALEYVNKALDVGGDTYYFHRVKSLVQAALHDYGEAIVSAQKSMELAAIQEKDEFVRMNRKNIDRWTELIKKDKK
ncbi:MAG: DUF2911 domain-containing protein [Saonia sp.]